MLDAPSALLYCTLSVLIRPSLTRGPLIRWIKACRMLFPAGTPMRILIALLARSGTLIQRQTSKLIMYPELVTIHGLTLGYVPVAFATGIITPTPHYNRVARPPATSTLHLRRLLDCINVTLGARVRLLPHELCQRSWSLELWRVLQPKIQITTETPCPRLH